MTMIELLIDCYMAAVIALAFGAPFWWVR